MRHALLIVLFALAAGSASGAAYFRISPTTGEIAVGQVVDVTIQISTDTGVARGGAVDIVYDPLVYEVVGGAAGITKAPESVYGFTPGPVVSATEIQIPFLKSDFTQVSYTGRLATFQLHVLSKAGNPNLTFKADSTRFAPTLVGTQLIESSYTFGVSAGDIRDYLLGSASAPPDQNGDGVIDVADLLTKL